MNKLKVKDITLIAMMVAVIEVCKIVLSSIPNVELTSFWIIMFSLYFGKRIYLVIVVFILIEGLMFGINLWWIMYLYTWPLLAFVSMRFKDHHSVYTWVMISGIFGLLFGLLCSFPYIVVGTVGYSLLNGLKTAFAWWVAGIPWDIVHGLSNMVIMFILYYPVIKVMNLSQYRID